MSMQNSNTHSKAPIRMCRAAIGFRQHFKSVPQEFTEQAGRLEQTGQLGELGQNPGGSTGAFYDFYVALWQHEQKEWPLLRH